MSPQSALTDAQLFANFENLRAEYLRTTFAKTSVAYRPTIVGTILGGIKEELGNMANATAAMGQEQASTMSAADAIVQEVKAFLAAMFNVDLSLIQEIVEELGIELFNSVVEVMADAVPFVGTTISGGRTLKAWSDVAFDAHKKFKVHRAANAILPGDPSAAVGALKQMVSREMNADMMTAGRLTGQTAVQATADGLTIAEVGAAPVTFGGTALIAAPTALMGPAAALISSTLGLVHHLFLIARDFLERRRVNKRLKSGQGLDSSLFEVCPLVGCYYLTLADTSTILNFKAHEMAQPSFEAKIIRLRKQVEPVLVQASKVILKHRFVLDGIDGQTAAGITLISKGKVLRGDGVVARIKRAKAAGKRQMINAVAGPARRQIREIGTSLNPML